MKKIIFSLLTLTLLSGCINFHPKGNEKENPSEDTVAVTDAPAFYEKTVQWCKLEMAIEECDRNMKRAKSSMAIWSGPYQSAFGRNNYQEAKDEYDENARNKKSAEIKVQKLTNELNSRLEEERQFIGFRVRHRYRANTNDGTTLFGEMEYLFDKDLSKIVARYDMDGGEYKAVQNVYKQMLGEDVLIENENFNDSEPIGE